MKKYFEPKKPGHYKRRCHELMVEIWGDDKDGWALAYKWLLKNFGIQHFKTTNDEKKLKEVYEALWKKSFKDDEIVYKDGMVQTAQLIKAPKKEKPNYDKVFSNKSVLREVGWRNTISRLPWYKRIFYSIFAK